MNTHTSVGAWHKIVALCVALYLFGSIFATSIPSAQATHEATPTFHDPIELSGFTWSDTVGWVSFNCNQLNALPAIDTCGTVDYKVEIIPDSNPLDDVVATIEGYAWSEHLGWIKFGGLSNFPDATYYQNAEIRSNGGSYYMYGWARACAGTLPGDCSSMTDHPDGWDGWISLTCENTGCVWGDPGSYRIQVLQTGFGGEHGPYAWGSDVMGWIDFDYLRFNAPCTTSNMCTVDDLGTIQTDLFCVQQDPVACTSGFSCVDATGTCSWGTVVGLLEATRVLIRKEETTDLSWEATVVTGAVDSCYVEGTNGDTFMGTGNGLIGTDVTTSPIDEESVTYTLYCLPQGGGTPVEIDTLLIKTLPMVVES